MNVKQTIVILIFVNLVLYSWGQPVLTDTANCPYIVFSTTVHDFGTIKSGQKAEFDFVFKNTGNEPLVVTTVSASCGCTVPEFSKKPYKKNKKGEIKVRYNTSYLGPFQKTVTVVSNACNSPVKLVIMGNVIDNE